MCGAIHKGVNPPKAPTGHRWVQVRPAVWQLQRC